MAYLAILPERARLDGGLVVTVAAVPGVQQAEAHVFDAPATRNNRRDQRGGGTGHDY
ncbi:MAG: hypothetical protein ACTH2Q_21460 [Propionibacteriaceae bacterium]